MVSMTSVREDITSNYGKHLQEFPPHIGQRLPFKDINYHMA